MIKITWLGEDTDDTPGPSFLTWNGVRFPKGQAVDVDNIHMISKARGNPAFKVGNPEKAHVEKITQGHEEKQKEQGEEKEGFDYRQAEKGTGYTPVKKKVRKKRPASHPFVAPDPDA